MGRVLVKTRIKFCLVLAFTVVAVGELQAQGFLISDTTRTGMVFDFAGQNLYILTSTGLTKTFDLSTRSVRGKNIITGVALVEVYDLR